MIEARPLIKRYGHLEVVDFLLSAVANINHLDATGMSPLFGAAQRGHLKVVKLLVKRGVKQQMRE
jgi:ankyrin repeat protein